jgi:hypothetical protein
MNNLFKAKKSQIIKPLRKADFEAYLAVSPRMTQHERYGNKERLKQLDSVEGKRRKEGREAAVQSMKNRQPQAAVDEQSENVTPQYQIQYYGFKRNAKSDAKE